MASLAGLAFKAAGIIANMGSARALGWTAAAASHWQLVYPNLSEGNAGLFGAMTARAEAQTIRLALIYAALDGCECIDLPHLLAALEVWRYCEDSVRAIFGDALGDDTADAIVALLRTSPGGVSQTDLNIYFQKHKRSAEIQRALGFLQERGLVRIERHATDGRPRISWFAVS